MLQKYEDYLETLKNRLDEYFTNQKEFIKCANGCGLCCTLCYYPASELEYKYLKIGIDTKLSEEEKENVNKKAIQIIKDRTAFLKTNSNVFDFTYECPLLINKACPVYDYRPLLCRTHGLLYQDISNANKINAPICKEFGLNYSNINDTNLKTTPEVYDLSYSSVMRDAQGVEFGDVRMLVEWIVMDIPNWQELIKS